MPQCPIAGDANDRDSGNEIRFIRSREINLLASEIAGDGGADKRTEELSQEDPADVCHEEKG